MGRKYRPADDDLALFREHVADVQPLKDSGRTTPQQTRPEPRPRQLERDERRVINELLEQPVDPAEMDTGEELTWLRPGLQKRYLVRLRRGQYSIAASLDLHQMNSAAAHDAILEFLDHALERRYGCVRIVHGKGLRSRKGPVLKLLTRRLLSRHAGVAAFASCRPVDGGTGAVAVLLRNTARATGGKRDAAT